MKLTFLHISDLHYRPDWPEQMNLVLTKFLEDVREEKKRYGEIWLIFSGDLVRGASEDGQYKAFHNHVSKILDDIGIKVNRRICVPGNHDVSRSALKSKIRSARGALAALTDEDGFLSELASLNEMYFAPKFVDYLEAEKSFAAHTCCQNNLGGNGWALSDEVGLFCLNTALCSFAGLEDPDTGNPISDKEKLCIDTRSLYQWEQQTTFATRILVMHHPLEWLSEWAHTELDALISAKFDLVFSGHVHKGETDFHFKGGEGSIFCRAPALFTRKTDQLGYAFVTIDSDKACVEINYRQWTGKNFVLGVNLSENDKGRITLPIGTTVATFNDPALQSQNLDTESVLEEEFHEASTCYSSKRQLWVERDLAKHPETTANRESTESVPSSNLVTDLRSCVIRAPKEFGLTCLGRKIALEHFRKNGRVGILLMCDSGKIDGYKAAVLSYIHERCSDLKCEEALLAGIILDNWQNAKKGSKILEILRENFKDLPIIVLQGFDDFNDFRNPAVLTSADGFEMLYLRALTRARIREIVHSYLESAQSTLDDEIVTKKLIEDIDALNTHRTPLNCLLLLKLIERSFDDSPVNRTEVIRKVLFALFHEFDKIPKYSARPDLTDCEFALGYLCEWMLRSNRHSFRREEFFEKVHEYCKNQLIRFDSDVLFNFLCSENILIRRGIDFAFRLAYWRFYFTALRMHHNDEFSKFILGDSRYTAFPEVVEFYTGIDRRRTDAVTQLSTDLRRMDVEFLTRTKIPNDFNPWVILKWNPSDEVIARMHQNVTNSIQESAMPSDVKDAVADGSYDRSKPYHQEVNEWIRTSSLDQMVQAMKAAARALRNSDHVAPAAKEALLESVLSAWVRLCQILAVLSPILATNRHAQFEGMGFILADGFEDEKDATRIWKLVMSGIVDNVVSWHQLDLFSKKLGPLFESYLKANEGKIGELLILLVLVKQRPIGWKESVTKFIARTTKNSFYLNRIYFTLLHEFRYGFAPEEARQQMRTLAAMAVAKHATGAKYPNQKLIAKAASAIDADLAKAEDDKDEAKH